MGTSKTIQQPRQLGSWAPSQGPGVSASQSRRAWGGGPGGGAARLRRCTSKASPSRCHEPLGKSHTDICKERDLGPREEQASFHSLAEFGNLRRLPLKEEKGSMRKITDGIRGEARGFTEPGLRRGCHLWPVVGQGLQGLCGQARLPPAGHTEMLMVPGSVSQGTEDGYSSFLGNRERWGQH